MKAVVIRDNAYGLAIGHVLTKCWRKAGDASPFPLMAEDADGRLYQFKDDEVTVGDRAS